MDVLLDGGRGDSADAARGNASAACDATRGRCAACGATRAERGALRCDRGVGRLAAHRQGSRWRRARTRWRYRRRWREGAAVPAPAQPAGAVFAFKRGADGQYAYHSTIASAADAAATAGDRFGSAIALTGTTALIGASGQNAGAGVVHEFAVDADAWKSVRTFAPIGAQGTRAAFGSLVASTAMQAFVAAPGDAGGYGAVYVFGKVAQPGRGRGWRCAAPAAPVRRAAARRSTSVGGNEPTRRARGGPNRSFWDVDRGKRA